MFEDQSPSEWASWYQRNKEKARANIYKRRETHRVKGREFICEYLSKHPCVDCGEGDILVLEFDHVKGIKKMNLGDLVYKGATIPRIEREIAKCEVRCANCHKRRTWKDLETYKVRFLDPRPSLNN